MNLNNYSVLELDNNESKMLNGGSRLSLAIGFIVETYVIAYERLHSSAPPNSTVWR